MQIRLGTARGVGYSGDAEGLLDPDTNLTYAVKYLAGAYRAAGCDADRAVSYYQRGYYGAAQRECAECSALCRSRKRSRRPTAKVKREWPRPSRADTAAAKPADVIKPKVVRTETIATPKSAGSGAAGREFRAGAALRRRPAAARPAQPNAARPANARPSRSRPSSTLARRPSPRAAIELASVPMPPVRPEFDPGAEARSATDAPRRTARTSVRDKKSRASRASPQRQRSRRQPRSGRRRRSRS